MIKNFIELSKSKKTVSKTLVVAAAHDKETLEAINIAERDFNIKYILVGDRNKIISESSNFGFSIASDKIIDTNGDEECVKVAVELIKNDAGDALMKGLLDTGALLKAVLNKKNDIRGTGVLSHMALLEVQKYNKLIGITDGGMIPNPTFEQKVSITTNAAKYFTGIGYDKPKIAALCASETVNEKIPETVDAAELQKQCQNGSLGDCILEGPVSFDIAVDKNSAQKKKYPGKIGGEADILLVPNITVGNVLAKGLIYWAGAKMAGCILGAKIPIVLASRGASAEEKVLSIMMSLIQ